MGEGTGGKEGEGDKPGLVKKALTPKMREEAEVGRVCL